MTTALLDTCVLVPSRARDVLLEIASTGVYRPLWSTEILAELDRTLRHLLAKRGAAADRHVVAAARAGRADVIVTGNLADFPPAALPASITRQSLDDFLLDIFDLHPGQVITAVRAIAGRTGKSGPRLTASEIAAYLATHGTPLFGERLMAAINAAP